MLINSLQLIAHVPLIANKLPANAHYFLLNFLGLVRFNFEFINSQLDSLSQKMGEMNLLASDESYYSADMRTNGYHFSFIRNMMFAVSVFLVICLVWLFSAIFQLCRNKAPGAAA